MTMAIKKVIESADRAAIEAVQGVEDKDNNLPLPGCRKRKDGTFETIDTPAPIGWTTHVYDVEEDKGTYRYPCSDALSAAIAAAKARPEKDRTSDESALAAVQTTDIADTPKEIERDR